ncbi:unnamed protein product [Paramecium pentaurelia]|uniref:60S ribosome subunit biogenesis protein NIP7 homolog n=1 Tax=Paramecium pentaurelia TaxID=43138 RepID=A0A8S1TX04_9CILI|nr:unnamed protein product [Paramecium pentaurelia]
MRQLNEEETKIFFEKLGEYIGANIKLLIENEEDPHVFRLIKNKVYYMSLQIANWATNVGKDELLHVGTYFGKFTKTKKFRLNITCLEILAKYAKHKVWLKSSGEQSFLYGNHVIKAHLAKMSENIPQYANVILFSLQENPLGFGVASRSTLQCKDLDPTTVVVFNQADLGEYLRAEDDKNIEK